MTENHAPDAGADSPIGAGPLVLVADLPDGWTGHVPDTPDLADLHALARRHQRAARGRSSVSRVDVDTEVTGAGAQTRRHVLTRDPDGVARGWGTVHDRAAGRVIVSVVVDPDLDVETADALADSLFAWAARAASQLGVDRGLTVTQMDSGAYADDERQQRWLAGAGFDLVRTWWQMSRPVDAAEGAAGALPEPRPGVVVRRVQRSGDGMPDRADLVAVHDVLETSFTDHFNYHEETFDEFLARLREDPGHRWDHWWLAELVDDPQAPPEPVGALLGTVLTGDNDQPDGSYVAYLGVLQSARGRGVARSLLHTVIADAAQRGRDRVALEVDADSPTGADALYTSMGFATSYITQSWHKDLPVDG